MKKLEIIIRHSRVGAVRDALLAVGVTGMSMGSTRSWWLAALDDRVAAAVGGSREVIAYTFRRRRSLYVVYHHIAAV